VSDSTPFPTVGGVYTMREAARLKGVSYHTISRTVRTGKLVAQRIGRMAMIGADDLDAWHPIVEKTPHKYRDRQPDPTVSPVLMDIVAGEWAEMHNGCPPWRKRSPSSHWSWPNCEEKWSSSATRPVGIPCDADSGLSWRCCPCRRRSTAIRPSI